MKKKLSRIALILISEFAFTACGDSKEAVVDDMIEHMQESLEASASGDKDAIAEIKEKGKKLEERAKTVGIDPKDLSTMPNDLRKKFEEADSKLTKK